MIYLVRITVNNKLNSFTFYKTNYINRFTLFQIWIDFNGIWYYHYLECETGYVLCLYNKSWNLQKVTSLTFLDQLSNDIVNSEPCQFYTPPRVEVADACHKRKEHYSICAAVYSKMHSVLLSFFIFSRIFPPHCISQHTNVFPTFEYSEY